jgi:hypothetical protein
VLDGAFQAARRNPKAMFGSALLVQAFSAVLTAVVLLIVLGSGASAFLAADDAQDFEGLGGLVVTMMAGVLVAAVLQAIATMILQGVLVVPVVRSVLNGKTGFRQMWRLARPRLGTLTILALLYAAALMAVFALLALSAWGLITILGLGGAALAVLMLLAVFALFLWLGVKLLLAPAVVILEDLPLGAALRRSWQLTTGQWWRTFGTAVLAQIIAGVVGAVIAVPVSFAANIIAALVNPTPTEQEQIVQVVVVQAVALIVNTLIGGITLAFQSGVLALIAMDLKMRKDGFDVALMKEQENVPADAVDYHPGLPGGLHGGRVERPVS